MIRRWVRRLWRMLCGRCTLCGALKPEHPTCWHCANGNPRWCHRCNKRLDYAKAYGAGPATIARLCTESSDPR